jgi:hypothetical protein
MAVERLQFIHCMYINFIQSFSSNHWIKINFDSKWTLKLKILSCKYFKKLLMFRIAKKYHQDFSLLRTMILAIYHLFWWKVVDLQCAFTRPYIFPPFYFSSNKVLFCNYHGLMCPSKCPIMNEKQLIDLNQQKVDGTYFVIFCEFQIV